MKVQTRLRIIVLIWLMIFASKAKGQVFLWRAPTVIIGGSAGYYRAALENFSRYYDSRWGGYFSAQTSFRFYRMNYLSLQYANFHKTKSIASTGTADWNQQFINLGVRWYYEGRKRWRSYAGFGFAFVTIQEKSGFSLLRPNVSGQASTHGSGFFLEIGWDYVILSPLAINLEFEVSSAGEGGNPGIAGSSLGGYAILAGFNVHL